MERRQVRVPTRWRPLRGVAGPAFFPNREEERKGLQENAQRAQAARGVPGIAGRTRKGSSSLEEDVVLRPSFIDRGRRDEGGLRRRGRGPAPFLWQRDRGSQLQIF